MDDIPQLIINVYKEYGKITIEEDINQLEHAKQCAKFATDAKSHPDLIVASLLHDIGQLPPEQFGLFDLDIISNKYGSLGHEYIGGKILKHLGFNDNIIDLVQNHVNAKRFLLHKNQKYKLSKASQMTLDQQGGIMEYDEYLKFKQKPNYKDIIKLRLWDDKAKIKNYEVPSIDSYKKFIVFTLTQKNVLETG
jgi:predicted HD phosphohydrolase